MCTDNTRCELGDAIKRVIRERYSDHRNVSEEQVLGDMIAAHFRWNGQAILKTSALALEDANYHDECEQVMHMLKRFSGPKPGPFSTSFPSNHDGNQ
jgi:hypothetical protein